jgi:hypothetical protein
MTMVNHFAVPHRGRHTRASRRCVPTAIGADHAMAWRRQVPVIPRPVPVQPELVDVTVDADKRHGVDPVGAYVGAGGDCVNVAPACAGQIPEVPAVIQEVELVENVTKTDRTRPAMKDHLPRVGLN